MAEVTEELCKARTAAFDTKLDAISRDIEETRRGVGTLNRKLFEGNGSAALDTVIRTNTEFRIRQEKRAEAQEKFKWTRNLGWMIAGAGWAVAVIIMFVQRAFGL